MWINNQTVSHMTDLKQEQYMINRNMILQLKVYVYYNIHVLSFKNLEKTGNAEILFTYIQCTYK